MELKVVSYNPFKWPYKRVTGVITPTNGVITPFITGFLGPPCIAQKESIPTKTHKSSVASKKMLYPLVN